MAEWTHPRIPPSMPTADRLLFIGWDVTVTKCWEWRGSRSKLHGYGRIDIDRRRTEAHRLAYETWVGPIPEGHVVMHSCDNPPCINPMHLSTGTQAENIADRDAKGRHYRSGQTHCIHGHEFTPENTYTSTNASGGTSRRCKTCVRRREQLRTARVRRQVSKQDQPESREEA